MTATNKSNGTAIITAVVGIIGLAVVVVGVVTHNRSLKNQNTELKKTLAEADGKAAALEAEHKRVVVALTAKLGQAERRAGSAENRDKLQFALSVARDRRRSRKGEIKYEQTAADELCLVVGCYVHELIVSAGAEFIARKASITEPTSGSLEGGSALAVGRRVKRLRSKRVSANKTILRRETKTASLSGDKESLMNEVARLKALIAARDHSAQEQHALQQPHTRTNGEKPAIDVMVSSIIVDQVQADL